MLKLNLAIWMVALSAFAVVFWPAPHPMHVESTIDSIKCSVDAGPWQDCDGLRLSSGGVLQWGIRHAP